MSFLKNFFNDNSTIVGLCGFNLEKSKGLAKPCLNTNPYAFSQFEKLFTTNTSENILLI